MNNVFLRASLCGLVVCGSSLLAQGSAPFRNSPLPQDEFEQLLRGKIKTDFAKREAYKKVYKGLLDKALKTFEDKEVVAARVELYKAVKKVKNLVEKKFELSQEEIQQSVRFANIAQKQNNGEYLSEEEESVLLSFKLAVFEILQQYPPEVLEKMLAKEVELFEKS